MHPAGSIAIDRHIGSNQGPISKIISLLSFSFIEGSSDERNQCPGLVFNTLLPRIHFKCRIRQFTAKKSMTLNNEALHVILWRLHHIDVEID